MPFKKKKQVRVNHYQKKMDDEQEREKKLEEKRARRKEALQERKDDLLVKLGFADAVGEEAKRPNSGDGDVAMQPATKAKGVIRSIGKKGAKNSKKERALNKAALKVAKQRPDIDTETAKRVLFGKKKSHCRPNGVELARDKRLRKIRERRARRGLDFKKKEDSSDSE